MFRISLYKINNLSVFSFTLEGELLSLFDKIRIVTKKIDEDTIAGWVEG